MKITKSKLKQIIREELQEFMGRPRPRYGEGNLTIDDVKELLPQLSPGEQTDVWEKYKHLNNQDDLRRALRMNEEETWPDKESSGELGEVLGPDAEVGEYIEDFQDSDAPQFKGKSKKKKAQMAYAAHAAAKEQRGKKWWHKQKHLLTHG